MAKKLKPSEYKEKYGGIPKEYTERFLQLWDGLKIKEKDLVNIQNLIKTLLNIKKKEIRFIFYFIPEATPRPRYSRFTKSFYVKNAADYAGIFNRFVKSIDDIEQIITPTEFICKTYKPTPSAMNRYEQILSELELIKDISKPDWDNLAKTYCDMIQHGLILDDSIIYKGSLEKLYSAKPRIEITLKYYDKFDCTYNKRKITNILTKRERK